ncbi:hypothetical protein [Streptomyces sp. Act143]|uniref:hypothetical protein n=1 Tax=Streptomyces sp. Act143 TaxID=2200760 RepID=UPI0011B790C4|nr:hypothetical protein [Streptomyces sp. Act143]
MNVSVFPVAATDIDSGFDHVISQFRSLESEGDAGEWCDLGEDAGVVEELLIQAGGGEIARLAVAGGSILGDDNFGTVCSVLLVDEVARVSGFFAEVDLDGVMGRAPEVLAGILRGGIPVGYLDDLAESVAELRQIFGLAQREGLCVAHIYEG